MQPENSTTGDSHVTRTNSPAWRAEEEFGFDMSMVEDRLAATPAERLERNERARQAILMIRAAGVAYYGFDPRDPEAPA